MRKTCFALLALGCATLPAWGQPPAIKAPTAGPTAAALDPQRNALDAYLMHWEEAMKKVNTLAVACTRTEVDAVYKTRRTLTGTIHFMKPTYFFWHMGVKDKPADYERFICTGTYIYQYLPSQKQIKVYPAPKTTTEGKLADDSSLAFMFGMKAAEAKARYDLKLHNVDSNYVYVDVVSKTAVDKADFLKARLVLDKTTYLPRQLWFEHPNGGEVLWDLTTAQSNAQINKAVFAAPTKPGKDWEMVQAHTQEPRLVRPQKN